MYNGAFHVCVDCVCVALYLRHLFAKNTRLLRRLELRTLFARLCGSTLLRLRLERVILLTCGRDMLSFSVLYTNFHARATGCRESCACTYYSCFLPLDTICAFSNRYLLSFL